MQWLFDIFAQIPDAYQNTVITMIILAVTLAVICFIGACIHAVLNYKN